MLVEYTAAHPYLRSPSRSLLGESIRRDVTELNRQFVTAMTVDAADMLPRRWRGLDTRVLSAPGLIDVVASCPFTLFELRLDAPTAGRPDPPSGADGPGGMDPPGGSREALAQSALTLAWRLAESSPLSLRLALGLSAAAELAMNEIRVTGLPALARKPGLMRTRWVAHDAFWLRLLRAAHRRDAGLLARVYCIGITLLVADLGAEIRAHESSPNGARSRG